jgi:hypothetical protein
MLAGHPSLLKEVKGMPRHYSPRDFLRLAPNALLERYFHERDLLTGIDFRSLKETEVQPVFDAWWALPPEKVAEANSDFALVTALADEQGIQAILDEAEYQKLDLTEDLEAQQGLCDKALWTFLEHRDVAEAAHRFCEVERLPYSYWVRRRDGLLGIKPRQDEEALAKLGEALGSYFRLKEGRGHECIVEVYRRGSRLHYFAFPEDYSQTSLEYTDTKKLERRAHRPVFQVVFVCDPELGSLDTFFRGQKRTRLELETIFSRVILGKELDAWKDDRVYNLNTFRSRGVKFVYDPASGIQDVQVKLLRLSLMGGPSQRVVLEADPSERRGAVYDLLDEISARSGDGSHGGLSLALASVTRVGLQVFFSPGRRRGRNTKTFYLTYPNGCTLGHDGRDAVLRQMLVDSKIETKPAATAAKA